MAHSAVLAKVNTEVGRGVVRGIPSQFVRPAKLLVDEAIGIVGRYAVVRAKRPPSQSVLATLPQLSYNHEETSSFHGTSLLHNNEPTAPTTH
jgi:hypothetical protein